MTHVGAKRPAYSLKAHPRLTITTTNVNNIVLSKPIIRSLRSNGNEMRVFTHNVKVARCVDLNHHLGQTSNILGNRATMETTIMLTRT